MLAGTDDHLTWLSPVILNLENMGLTHLESEIRVLDDVNAVEIRQWLWKRPYTTLELQHYPGTDRKYNTADLSHESGFTALAFVVFWVVLVT